MPVHFVQQQRVLRTQPGGTETAPSNLAEFSAFLGILEDKFPKKRPVQGTVLTQHPGSEASDDIGLHARNNTSWRLRTEGRQPWTSCATATPTAHQAALARLHYFPGQQVAVDDLNALILGEARGAGGLAAGNAAREADHANHGAGYRQARPYSRR